MRYVIYTYFQLCFALLQTVPTIARLSVDLAILIEVERSRKYLARDIGEVRLRCRRSQANNTKISSSVTFLW